MQGAQRAERERVVEAEDGVGAYPGGEQVAHGGGAVRAVPGRRGRHQAVVVRDAGLGQRGGVAGQAEPGAGALGGALGADRGDPAAAEPDQVGGDLAGGGHVVDHDVVGGAVVDPFAEQHHGQAVQGGEVVGGERERAQDQAVDHVVADAAGGFALLFGAAAGLVDEDRPVVVGGGGDDVPGQLGEVGDVELGHGQGDHPGTPFAQVAGRQVGPVVECGDGLLDPGPGVGAYVLVAVDDVGDGLHRHSGPLRDVLEPVPH